MQEKTPLGTRTAQEECASISWLCKDFQAGEEGAYSNVTESTTGGWSGRAS